MSIDKSDLLGQIPQNKTQKNVQWTFTIQKQQKYLHVPNINNPIICHCLSLLYLWASYNLTVILIKTLEK